MEACEEDRGGNVDRERDTSDRRGKLVCRIRGHVRATSRLRQRRRRQDGLGKTMQISRWCYMPQASPKGGPAVDWYTALRNAPASPACLRLRLGRKGRQRQISISRSRRAPTCGEQMSGRLFPFTHTLLSSEPLAAKRHSLSHVRRRHQTRVLSVMRQCHR